MSEQYQPTPNQKTRPQEPNVVSLSRHQIAFDTLPDGRATSVQPLDSIELGRLDEAYEPGRNIPQEISFTVGPQRHVMFSSREFPAGFEKLVTSAEDKGIPIGNRASTESDSEEYPWLHAQFNDKGDVVGVETIAPDVIRHYSFENGKGYAPNLPAVRNLQARWYEAPERLARSTPEPASELSTKEGQVGASVEAIGSGLGNLTGLFERINKGNAARAAELGIPVSKLSVEELNAVLRRAKGE